MIDLYSQCLGAGIADGVVEPLPLAIRVTIGDSQTFDGGAGYSGLVGHVERDRHRRRKGPPLRLQVKGGHSGGCRIGHRLDGEFDVLIHSTEVR